MTDITQIKELRVDMKQRVIEALNRHPALPGIKL